MLNVEIIREEQGYALLRRSTRKRAQFTVVGINRKQGQVYSAMPSDRPQGGGQWFGGLSDKGVDYVAHWYSRSWANHMFTRLSREAVELG